MRFSRDGMPRGRDLGTASRQGVLAVGSGVAHSNPNRHCLNHAHRHGIIHRDLKPANVMLKKAGAKLRDYLLSRTHPVGRFKARFFTALGFSAEQWRELETALRTDHLSQPAESVGTNERGQKYSIRAILKGPSARRWL